MSDRDAGFLEGFKAAVGSNDVLATEVVGLRDRLAAAEKVIEAARDYVEDDDAGNFATLRDAVAGYAKAYSANLICGHGSEHATAEAAARCGNARTGELNG